MNRSVKYAYLSPLEKSYTVGVIYWVGQAHHVIRKKTQEWSIIPLGHLPFVLVVHKENLLYAAVKRGIDNRNNSETTIIYQ
ncbi:hypothetical protein DOY81_007399 [Sarcophaga bullata]|nr:hypothetical protein DOY81_007399 [Sarcophaga bullata]